MSVSSPAWVDLQGIDPYFGIEYVAATGTFLIKNIPNSASSDHVITVEELVGEGGSTLNVPAGVELRMQNHAASVDGQGEGFALINIAFDEPSNDHYVDIPEPRSYGLILSILALSVAMVRRRR